MNHREPPHPQDLRAILDQLTHTMPLAVVAGSHLYGFAGPGSDHDLRGYHQNPITQVLGLDDVDQTIRLFHEEPPVEVLSHEIRKYLNLLLRHNGNILEEILAPNPLASSADHPELRDIAQESISRSHASHYLGMARQMRARFQKEPDSVKPALHLYRIYLTGIRLMRTGELVTHLPTLNQDEQNPLAADLVARRTSGHPNTCLSQGEWERCNTDLNRLAQRLDTARENTDLPPTPRGRDRCNDLLLRIRRRDLSP